MKFYVAGKLGRHDGVISAYEKIREKGHEVIVDWTPHKPIKPYAENPQTSREYAIEDANGSKNCDVFILISSDDGTGMYVELDLTLASNIETGKPKIYVVGEHNKRSRFFFHPSVNQKDTIEAVFEDLGI